MSLLSHFIIAKQHEFYIHLISR